MTHKKNDESGIIVVAIVFLAAILIFAFVAIRNISRSKEASELQQSASELVDTAEGIIPGN